MEVMILSPHRDDAAFSCGLLLAGMLQAGCSVRIVNVCTVSSYAPYLTRGLGDRTQQVTDSRRNEDARFVDTLCASVHLADASIQLIDLGWHDLPLRWQTEDDTAIAPAILPPAEVELLRDAFNVLPHADLVFSPRGWGGHIDHRLVYRAAQEAFPASSLVLYEDLPYACNTSAPVTHAGAMTESWLSAGKVVAGLKRELCLCYPSQIDETLAEMMDQYGHQHGGERFLALPDTMRTLRTALHMTGAGI